MANSTRAVIPWNVRDTKKFSSKVKEPIPGEYWTIWKHDHFPLDSNLLNELRSEGINENPRPMRKLSESNVGYMVDMYNVKDIDKLMDKIAKKAVNYVNTEHFRQNTLNENDSIVYYMYAPDNKPFRITTSWDDPIGDYDTTTWILQNNIDVSASRRYSSSSVTRTVYPWVLDPNPIVLAKSNDNLTNDIVRANPAKRGIDSLNTLVSTLSVESMLNFRNSNAWYVDSTTPWVELNPVYISKDHDTIAPAF